MSLGLNITWCTSERQVTSNTILSKLHITKGLQNCKPHSTPVCSLFLRKKGVTELQEREVWKSKCTGSFFVLEILGEGHI